MRKVFLIIGALCALAALVIIIYQGDRNPFSRDRRWKANKERHGTIISTAFSPNGDELIFTAYDELGELHATQTYLYSLERMTLHRLDTNQEGAISGFFWAPDSIHVGFNRYRLDGTYVSRGCTFNIKTNSMVEQFQLPFVGWSPDGNKMLFKNMFLGTMYIKEPGKPVWHPVPRELRTRGDTYCWAPDSRSLIYLEDTHSIRQYSLEDETSTILAHLEGNHLGFLYPSRHTSSIYFLTSRRKDTHRPVILWKLDIRSGNLTSVYDSKLDMDSGGYIRQIFLAPNDNPIYIDSSIPDHAGGKSRRGRLVLERLDVQTQTRETLLDEDFGIRDYCDKRDIFVGSYRSDHLKALRLFNPKTKTFQQIYPGE